MNWFDWAKDHLEKWKSQQEVAAKYWDVFTPRAQQVLGLAHQEAKQMNQNFIGTEHLLLGLIKLGQGVAVNVLKSLGLTLETVRPEVKRQSGVGSEKDVSDYIPMTPRIKKVLDTAKAEAKALGHTYVGTEHLLLGLLAENDGMAWRIFKTANVDFEKTRKEILSEITPKFP